MGKYSQSEVHGPNTTFAENERSDESADHLHKPNANNDSISIVKEPQMSPVCTTEKKTTYTQIQRGSVLLSAFVIIFIIIGTVRAISVLYVDIMDEFQASRSEAASVISLLYGSVMISGFVCGLVFRFAGMRMSGFIGSFLSTLGFALVPLAGHYAHLIIFIDIIAGFGMCLLYINVHTAVKMHFDGKGMAMAMSFVQFGGAIGCACVPYTFDWLNRQYGLRGCFLSFAGVLAQTMWLGILIRPKVTPEITSPTKPTLTVRPINQLTAIIKQTRKLCQNKSLVCTFVAVAFQLGASAMPLMIVVDYFMSIGYDREDGVFMTVLMNMGGLVSRLLPGLLKLIPHTSVFAIDMVASIIAGTAISLMPFVYDRPTNYVLVPVIGGCYSIGSTMMSVFAGKLVDESSFSLALGLITTLSGITLAISSPLAGLVRDISGSYDMAFHLSGVACFLSALMFFLAFILRRKQQSQSLSDMITCTRFRTEHTADEHYEIACVTRSEIY